MLYLYDRWSDIRKNLKNKFLFICLDFDGTLASITETPDKAILPEQTKNILKEISDSLNARLAFISGRTLDNIRSKIGIKNAIYSGNHGFEIEGPKIKFKPAVPSGFRKTLEKIKDDLLRKTCAFKGVIIEDKGLALSLHYRLAAKENIPKIKTIFQETVIIPLVKNKIRIKPGKMVLEIRPPVEWDKGKVVLWLLARQVFASKNMPVFPMYIGDDVTDEDAFKALKNKGLTIFVGEPKESYAQYYLKNINEVADFLKKICLVVAP